MNDEELERRILLINKKYRTGLSNEEEKELETLEILTDAYLDKEFPLEILTEHERNYLNELLSRTKL